MGREITIAPAIAATGVGVISSSNVVSPCSIFHTDGITFLAVAAVTTTVATIATIAALVAVAVTTVDAVTTVAAASGRNP